MYKLCSRCWQRMNVAIPSQRLSCSHVRRYSRWFALYEDVTPVEIPISELPSSSSYTHVAPIGLSSTGIRRSASGSYVPTLVDPSELGGRDIVDEETIGSVLGVATGNSSISQYDFDAMLATVEESNLEQPILDLVPSRDILPASTLRGSSPNKKPSRTLPEKERVNRPSSRPKGVRSRLSSLSTVAAAPTAPLVPSEVEKRDWLVQPGEKVVDTAQVESEALPGVSMREGEVKIEVLMDIVERSDMDGLRSLLAISFWPRAKLTPQQLSRIFALVVDQARDCEECREIIRDFACASPRHSLPSHIPLLLAARSVREEGIQRAMEAIQFHDKAFMMAPISLRSNASRRVSASRSLWMEVAKRSEEGDINEMYESGIRMGLFEGSIEMVEETLKEKMKRGESFSSIFRQWRAMGERYGSAQCGMGTVVKAAVNEEGDMRMDSLTSLSSFVAFSPALRLESFVAHLVVNLLSKGEEKEAKHVFSIVSIHGSHWIQILNNIERDHCIENLILIEKIANLITYGVIGDIRKGEGKNMKESKVDDVNEESKLEKEKVEVKSNLMLMLEKIVWKANGGKNERKKKGPKKSKKRVKVDQKEIHELVERIQRTWLNVERGINGTSSDGLTRLITWSMLHRLNIPHSISHLDTSNQKESIKRESDV